MRGSTALLPEIYLMEILPYRRDLASSNYLLFRALKQHSDCQKFKDDHRDVETIVTPWLVT
jgi:hypothetical protein